jgi:hypothetical protein
MVSDQYVSQKEKAPIDNESPMLEHKIIFDKNAQPDPNAEPKYHKSVPIRILLLGLTDIKDLDNDDPDALSELEESREEPDYFPPPQDEPRSKTPFHLSKSPGKSEELSSGQNPLFNSTVTSISPSESDRLKNNDPTPYKCNQIVPSTGKSTVIEKNTWSPFTPMMLEERNAIIKEESLIIPK